MSKRSKFRVQGLGFLGQKSLFHSQNPELWTLNFEL